MPKSFSPSCTQIVNLQIDEIVFQQAANEKLHGEVMDLFLLEADMPLRGLGADFAGVAGDEVDKKLVPLKGGAF